MSERYVDLTVDSAAAIRMAFLMTHYRSPVEMGPQKLTEARKILRRLALACEPCFDGPPTEIVNTLADDLNTPGCIAIMHGYRKNRQGRKLFASLRFLGFFGSTCLPDEIKTLPNDHIWSAQVVGRPELGAA